MMISTSTKALLFALAVPALCAEPDHGNYLDRANELKEGISTREDAIKLLGKPTCEDMVNGCSLCTWTDQRHHISMHFDQSGVLTDRKTWRETKA